MNKRFRLVLTREIVTEFGSVIQSPNMPPIGVQIELTPYQSDYLYEKGISVDEITLDKLCNQLKEEFRKCTSTETKKSI